MTPTAVADAARVLGELDGVTRRGRGPRRAWSGSAWARSPASRRARREEPALITLRYDGPDASGPVLGLVGKAVTFDTGGISIKNANKMSDMKFDMSGGAAVLGAIEAIAELRLPVRVVAVVGATENMPDGHAVKPGDVVTAANGTTIEIINTDAEGRLVLADCLTHAVNQGAERLVDIATLTGSIITALGNTHAGLFASDDDWAAQVGAAGTATGETVWRLPLHADYAKVLDSDTADVMNVNEARKAGSSVAAEFLQRFTADVPWAHLDIAGHRLGRRQAVRRQGRLGLGRAAVRRARPLAGALIGPAEPVHRAIMRGVRRAAVIWLVLFAAYAATIGLPAFGDSQFGGDEPHYLLTAESIVSDDDIDLRDEYATLAYRDWYPYVLERRGRLHNGQANEPTGAGFALLIAPAYALGGPLAVQLLLAALAALAFVLAAALARRVVPEPWASVAALACGLSPPALAAATTVSPELTSPARCSPPRPCWR